jgi:hypothetical protein
MSLPTYANNMFNKITFDEFVSQNRDSIRKSYFTKVYKTINSVNGDKLIEETIINDKELTKWYSVIDTIFYNFKLDKYTKNLICIYCEMLYTYKKNYYNGQNFGIETELKEIIDKIKPNKRSKIIDKYYNYETGVSEYLLEDGNYVPINESIGKPELLVSKDMLPKEILSIIDIQEYRNQQINKII